jgi:protein-tyrosine phosphatase
LFVCTGNICRSPTAERLAAAYGAEHGLTDVTASSAGTRAVIGHPIQHEAARIIEKLGGDVSDFAARHLSARIASKADVIITMTRAHRDVVLELAPRKLHSTFTLSEAAHLVTDCEATSVAELSARRPQLAEHVIVDITDPIGQSAEVLATVGSEIAALLPPVLELCRST